MFRFVHISNNTQDKAAFVFRTGSVMSREVQCLQHKYNYVTVLHPQDLPVCVSREGWEADICRDQRSCEHGGSEISTDTPMKMGPRSRWPGFLKTSFSFSLKVGMWSSLVTLICFQILIQFVRAGYFTIIIALNSRRYFCRNRCRREKGETCFQVELHSSTSSSKKVLLPIPLAHLETCSGSCVSK